MRARTLVSLVFLFAACDASSDDIAGPGAGDGANDTGAGATGDPKVGVGEDGYSFSGAANVAPRLRMKSNEEVFRAIKAATDVDITDANILPVAPPDSDTGFANMSATLESDVQRDSTNASRGCCRVSRRRQTKANEGLV